MTFSEKITAICEGLKSRGFIQEAQEIVELHRAAMNETAERMAANAVYLTEDDRHDLAIICDAAKKQGEWEIASLKRFFDEGERESDKKTLANFVAGCEAFAEMFRRSAK